MVFDKIVVFSSGNFQFLGGGVFRFLDLGLGLVAQGLLLAAGVLVELLDRVVGLLDREVPVETGAPFDVVLGEQRAVGDIVNTTSRIEGLCKYLGIRLLASADVLEGLQGFM